MKPIPFILIILIIYSCEPNIKDNKESIREKSCFCDSIYYNSKKTNNEEVLCYKGQDVYKLKNRGDTMQLSRHSLVNSKYLFERLIVQNEKLDLKTSLYLDLEKEINNTFIIRLIGPHLDSINVTLSNNKTNIPILNKTFLNNDIVLESKYLTDTLSIKVHGYEFADNERNFEKYGEHIIKNHEFYYESVIKLANYKLGNVLNDFKNCIGK